MKGIVFSEFIEMVEDVFGPDVADRIIDESDLPSGGAYTSVGTYDHVEMLTLVTHLSEATGIPVGDLVQTFGKHLCGRFTQLYPSFFEGVESSLDFLETIENHVHVEVLKLYPEAELPHFGTQRPDPDTLVMTYRSGRPFGALAHGLILGAAEHFGERVEVELEDLSGGVGNQVRFTVRRQSA
jgi:hypothetical protein